MQRFICVATAALALTFSAGRAHACFSEAPLILEDIRYADVVVVGRIEGYRIEKDWGEWFRSGAFGSKQRLSDYAQFQVVVRQTLKGRPAQILTAIWDNSTYGAPKRMPSGEYLIALRSPTSKTPPLRGPSATISPPPGRHLTVLQAPCAPAFLFKSESTEARGVRRILALSSG